MSKLFLKRLLAIAGFDIVSLRRFYEKINKWSIKSTLNENRLVNLVYRLRKIVPDISHQEESERLIFNDYWELKRRALQAFQCTLMLEALKYLSSHKLTVVDIGDSAGTHMLYLKALTNGSLEINSISVNLDKRAIEKIKARGLEAVLCRAEDLEIEEKNIDLFVSFEMLEHLHNPAFFLYRLAKNNPDTKFVITVPYVRNSRVGLHHIRYNLHNKVFAEDVHIFELSPEDWTLLFLHSGWKVIFSRIYYQYPRKFPFVSGLLARYWRHTDFEGFWGVILERDYRVCDLYQDWQLIS